MLSKIQNGRWASLLSRLTDPLRWKSSLYDLTVWFMFGIVVTTLLSRFAPGYPIIVGTESVQKGVYWLNREIKLFMVGDYVTFAYQPTQEWLKGRYRDGTPHTKKVLGVGGDTVYADAKLNLKLCHPASEYKPRECVSAGTPLAVDSKGRPMHSWIPANHQYTLAAGELWIYGNDNRSLDSRYHGPIKSVDVHGRAHLLFSW